MPPLTRIRRPPITVSFEVVIFDGKRFGSLHIRYLLRKMTFIFCGLRFSVASTPPFLSRGQFAISWGTAIMLLLTKSSLLHNWYDLIVLQTITDFLLFGHRRTKFVSLHPRSVNKMKVHWLDSLLSGVFCELLSVSCIRINQSLISTSWMFCCREAAGMTTVLVMARWFQDSEEREI